MRKFALILAMAFVVSSSWAGIAFADCKSNCHSQFQTCDQGCQYIKDDAKRLNCQNGCLSGYLHCLKRCDGKSAAIMNEEIQPYAYNEEISLSRVDAYETLTLTGTLVRRFAIGGETTGWAIELNIPLQVDGKMLDTIEVDSDNINMSLFENDTVKITGNLVKRTGIERGLYWVIEVKSIIVC